MMTKTDRTVAKIGRSTKKCDTFIEFARSVAIFPSPLRGRRGQRPGMQKKTPSDVRTARRSMPSRRLDLSRLRGDLAAGARAHEPVDDDPIARFEAGADNAEAILGDGPWPDNLRLDSAILLHRHHHLARLIGDECAVGD